MLQYFDYLLLVGFNIQDFIFIEKIFKFGLNKERFDHRKAEHIVLLGRFKINDSNYKPPDTYYHKDGKEICSFEYYLDVKNAFKLSPGEYIMLLIEFWKLHAKKSKEKKKKINNFIN